MYELGKVIGALLHYNRLKKSPNIENVEIYLDIDRVLDTFGPDVKKGILHIFAEGGFETMSEKKLARHRPTLEEITRRLNGASGSDNLGQLAGGSPDTGSVGGMAGGAECVGHLAGCGASAQAGQSTQQTAWEDWE